MTPHRLFTMRDYPRVPELNVEATHVLFNFVMAYIGAARHHELALAGTQCALLLIRVLIGGAPVCIHHHLSRDVTSSQIVEQPAEAPKSRRAKKDKPADAVAHKAGNLDVEQVLAVCALLWLCNMVFMNV